MSIGGLMRTSVSGMAAQSNRLATVAENVANVSTPGYKALSTQFSSMLLDAPTTSYSSGGVATSTRNYVSRQGTLESSSSKYDLGISGAGFMLVQDREGQISLTRAGSFVPDGEGKLINAAGFALLGFPVSGGSAGAPAVNGTAGLEQVSLFRSRLDATPTTSADIAANLPSGAAQIAPGDLPSANAAASTGSARTSIVVYGNLGEEVTLDIYYANTQVSGEWEVSAFNAADRAVSGGFPYASGPLSSATVVFDANGQIDPGGAISLSIPVPGGAAMVLDLEQTTQLATDFTVLAVNVNGNSPSDASSVEIGTDGTVYEVSDNGSRVAIYQIPLATVVSPDRLIPKAGNIFSLSQESGDMLIGAPGSGGAGSLVSGALENSTVDLSSELTDMIESQRNYTANSRVFQTGSEIMEVLVNLKR